MNKHAHTIYIYLCVYLLTCCFELPAQAGGPKGISPVVKAVFSPQLEHQITRITYAPHVSPPNFMIQNPHMNFQLPPVSAPQQVAIPVLKDKGISISDGKGKETGRHSIVPSAVTVLGSPAIARAEERTIMYLRQQVRVASTAEYIPPAARERWKEEFEALRVLWIKADPSPLEKLPCYFTHDVPLATSAYLQQEYTNLTQLIQQTYRDIMPKVIYSSMTNEGKQLGLEERVHINKEIFKVRLKVSILLKAINKDPYLLVQQKFWDRMFGAFNPLVKGILAKPTSIFRQDNRPFVMAEFALHNPDGTAPYLPNSKTMIAGEREDDDDFDEEQYAGTPQDYKRRAAQMAQEKQHKAAMIQLAEQERDELLQHIPANLRIAVINDDRLPLLNFEYWAKNGYLGKGATVATFRNGRDFLKEIRNGTHYHIVITDLVLEDGGVDMMEDFRILDSNAAVFASSKFYPGDGDDHSAQDLFNFGMDGYIWNNTNLNEGSFGYLQYLRQLNNYYYYKNKYGWQR